MVIFDPKINCLICKRIAVPEDAVEWADDRKCVCAERAL